MKLVAQRKPNSNLQLKKKEKKKTTEQKPTLRKAETKDLESNNRRARFLIF